MKMGLLTDDRWHYVQGATFAAGHKTKAALMGGDMSSYQAYRYSFPPNYSPALIAHSRQGFSLSGDAPYHYANAAGDSVTFSAKAGFYKPARY